MEPLTACACSLQCLYCERTFRDRSLLKDHMRKKQHRRINPRNREYDQFYVINYLVSQSSPAVRCSHRRRLPGPRDCSSSAEADVPSTPSSCGCGKGRVHSTTEPLISPEEVSAGSTRVCTHFPVGTVCCPRPGPLF